MSHTIKCSCGLAIAPQLTKCPRCGTRIVRSAQNKSSETDEQAEEQRRRLDARARVLNGHKLKWIVPIAAQDVLREQVTALTARLKRGDRSVSRANLAITKQAATAKRAGCWSWEHGPHGLNIVISAKGNRYVRARPNEYADLILDYTGRDHGGWYNGARVRLRKFAGSSIAKQLAKDEHAAKEALKRKREKRKARKEKKAHLKKLRRRVAA